MTKENKARLIGAAFIGVVIITLVSVAYNMTRNNMAEPRLPSFGPRDEMNNAHKISDFSLIDQTGSKVSKETFDGEIFVANFFFATCTGICPRMNGNLKKVYNIFEKDSGVMFISHTVNPEEDSVSVLKDYANSLGANDNKWKFVTGDKKQIYELARESYLAAAGEGDGGAEDFLHTQNLVLVDKEFEIRGYYDGTDSLAVLNLIKDIYKLKKEK